MFRNYLLTALRSLSRKKGLTLINLLGLSVGLASCLVILVFIQRETSFDTFYPDADRMYRLISEDSVGNDLNWSAVVIGTLAPRLQESIPAIEQVARLHRRGGVLSYGDALFDEDDLFLAGQSTFDMFGLTLISGSSALDQPNTMVISQRLAERLFGQEEAVGNVLRLDATHEVEVTGVLAPLPGPSHFNIEAMVSLNTGGEPASVWEARNQGWSYVRLSPGAQAADVETSINDNLAEYVTWMNLDAYYQRFRLQPVQDARLHSAHIVVPGNVSDIKYVTLFSIIGALILVLACVNFTNLATARAVQRAREVGMRKALGAGRMHIARQFLIESVGMAVVALLVALVLMEAALPLFNQAAGLELEISLLGNPLMALGFLGVAVVTGLLAGWYPALYLSRFQPVKVLKGGAGPGGSAWLRKALVVGQFAISAALIFGALGIDRQMEYIREQNLGFDTEQVVSIPSNGIGIPAQTLKDRFVTVAGVQSASHSMGLPFSGLTSSMEVNGQKTNSKRLSIDEDYVETLGLEITMGRAARGPVESNREAEMMVNEEWVRFMGWEDPLAQTMPVAYDDESESWLQGPIVGVVKNFHTGSAHETVMPTVLDMRPSMAMFRSYILVRLAGGSIEESIHQLEEAWKEMVPDKPFSFTFADDTVQAQYESETRMAKLFNVFTFLAIGIACLGLFGLAAYSAEQRTKEIGIRKVLGATSSGIVTMISGDFLKLVLVALVFALPLAWFGVERWLDGFAYRFEMGPALVISAALIVLVLAWLTVAYQSLRAAMSDPADSLRCE